jgi:glycosyltransferase involved in cell wall biosynthesis
VSRILREAVEDVRKVETIVVIAPTPFFTDCGGDVRIREEILLLRDLGYRIEVCTAPGGRDPEGVRVHRAPGLAGLARATPGPSLRRLISDLLLLATCARVIRRTRPCLLHGHRHGGALIGGILGPLFGVPCVADLPGSLSRERVGRGWVAPWLRGIERWIDRLADHLVVSSGPMAEDLRARFAIPAECITHVPDAVGHGFAAEPAPDVRRGLGIPPDHRVVVCMGISARARSLEVLTETMGRVLSARSDVSFVVIGFPGVTRLRTMFARSPWRDRVVFTGRLDVPTVAKVLAVADLAVSPKDSPTEGNGTLFHTMACGLPTVAFDTPVNREILGELGIWVGERSPDAFAARVLAALDGEDQVRRLGPALRARVAEGATWDHNRRLLADVYGRAREGFPVR